MVTFKIFGAKKTARALSLITSDITRDVAFEYEQLLLEAREKMKREIDNWDTIAATGTTKDMIVVMPPESRKKGWTTSIKSLAPWSSALEKGVRPHWVHRSLSPRLAQWIDRVFGPDTDFIFVGGNKTRIRKNNSDRKFFTTILEQYTKPNNLNETNIKGLEKSLKKFKQRTI